MKEIEEFFKVINGKKPVYGFEEDKETLRIIYNIEDADAWSAYSAMIFYYNFKIVEGKEGKY